MREIFAERPGVARKKHPIYRKLKPFHQVVNEYRPQLHRYLRSKLGNEADVEEIAQESYLRLLRVDMPELIRQPQNYLFRIAANIVHDFYLKQRRQPKFVEFETAIETDVEGEAMSPEDELSCRDAARKLEKIIAPLPAKQQAAFLLKKRDGLSHEEIAKRLGISVHSSRSYVSKCIAHCRMNWEE